VSVVKPCVGPGSCRIGVIRCQTGWHKRPLNQAVFALVSAHVSSFLVGCLGFCVVVDCRYDLVLSISVK